MNTIPKTRATHNTRFKLGGKFLWKLAGEVRTPCYKLVLA